MFHPTFFHGFVKQSHQPFADVIEFGQPASPARQVDFQELLPLRFPKRVFQIDYVEGDSSVGQSNFLAPAFQVFLHNWRVYQIRENHCYRSPLISTFAAMEAFRKPPFAAEYNKFPGEGDRPVREAILMNMSGLKPLML
jgi:hypothetical protein